MTDLRKLHANVLDKWRNDQNSPDLYESLDQLLKAINEVEESDRDVVTKQVDVIFNGKDGEKIDVLRDDFYSTLTPEAQGIAVIRDLLSKQKVFVHPDKLKNWQAYAERYQEYILLA